MRNRVAFNNLFYENRKIFECGGVYYFGLRYGNANFWSPFKIYFLDKFILLQPYRLYEQKAAEQFLNSLFYVFPHSNSTTLAHAALTMFPTYHEYAAYRRIFPGKKITLAQLEKALGEQYTYRSRHV